MEAYIQVVQSIGQQQVQEKPEPKAKAKPSASKRKTAGISNRAPAVKQKKEYDYSNMSDEEFDELTGGDILY